jgi:A/G-specific adenine glycosylase
MKIFKTEAVNLLPTENPGMHNQAVMEFGALQCTPGIPDCKSCPLKSICYAFQNNLVRRLPVNTIKKNRRLRYFYYLKIHQNSRVFLEKRENKDIWKSLYQFPLIESDRKLGLDELTTSGLWKNIFNGFPCSIRKISGTHVHLLTHQKIVARFLEIEISKPTEFIQRKCIQLNESNIHQVAVPRLIEKYLQESK